MGSNKKLSVIIPLYNVEAYVKKTALSVSRQADDRLEVIIVDDGSTDNSSSVCLSFFTNLDTKFIRQENLGLGRARNAGILAASGEYVLFLDGDDFLIEGSLINIFKMLDAEEPDVLFGRYLKWNSQTGFIKHKDYKYLPPNDSKARTEYILGGLPERSWNAWRYVCKRCFLLERGLMFEENVLCEDVEWSLKVLENAKKISFLQPPFYAYNFRRPNSIMNTFNAKRLIDMNHILGRLLEQYKDRPELCRLLVKQSFFYINEYCKYNFKDRISIFNSYKKIIPLYILSPSYLHKFTVLFIFQPCLYIISKIMTAIRSIRHLFLYRRLQTYAK